MNYVLCGMMGSGKTTVGKKLDNIHKDIFYLSFSGIGIKNKQ